MLFGVYRLKSFYYGVNFDEAKVKAIEISDQKGYTYVPRIFVPVGGGGLIAGVASLIKQLMPKIKIIAVEAEDAACLKAAIAAGHPVDLARVYFLKRWQLSVLAMKLFVCVKSILMILLP